MCKILHPVFQRLAVIAVFLLVVGMPLKAQYSYWYPCANLPAPRMFHAATSWPLTYWNAPYSDMYLFGGFNNGLVANSAWVASSQYWGNFNSSLASNWVPIAPMPTARYGHQSVALHNNLIYVLGGIGASNQYLGTLEIYNPSTGTWSTGLPMPTPRAHFALATEGDKLYAIGGQNSSGSLSSVDIYDPATNSWTTGTPMPTPRHGIQPIPYSMYNVNPVSFQILGGAGPGNAIFANESYYPATNSWTTGSPMVFPRAFYAAGMIAGTPMLSGGFDISGNISSDLFHIGWLPSLMLRQSYGAGPRAGHQILTCVAPYQDGIAMIGGNTQNITVDSTHFQLLTIVLPDIEIPLTATRENSAIQLSAKLPQSHNWQTYQWEKSTDGQDFTSLHSKQPIQMVDLEDSDWDERDISLFYRLAMQAQNGELTHSQVVEVAGLENATVQISPNPFSQQLLLKKSGDWTYSLHDVKGRILFQGNGNRETTLETAHLPGGIYLLTVKSDLGTVTKRLVKH